MRNVVTTSRKSLTSLQGFQGKKTKQYELGHGGAQWLSGRVFDLLSMGCGLEPHGHHCVVSLSKNINPSLVLVQSRKTLITERLLMGRKESNQTKKQKLGHGKTKHF